MSINIEKITDPVGLGEAPHWDDRQQALFFVSFTEYTIHKYVPATKKHTKTIIGDNTYASFIIPVEGIQNHFVVAMKRNILIVEWDGEEGSKVSIVKDLGEVESVKPDNTINDGKADPRGRLFTGTLGPQDAPLVFQKFKAGMFRLDSDKDHKIEKVWDEISLANGLAWDVKEKAMYYVDSLEYKIRKYDYDVDTGEISNLTYVFNLPENEIGALADGMTIDTDGNLWLAVFMGSCVLKIDPRKGEVLQTVKMPVTQVTSVTFGGPNLDVLFVTTGNVSILNTSVFGADKPPGGCTFMVTGLGVKGLPNVNFKYKL